ncbi:MAG TPA: tryptophan--tRNA ligase [Polyangiaceae bacterium]|nr:tryptophan--tRNA ligase [Polyangiaceae bacterium]
MRILSGVQPSGRLHLGNYFGAIRQFVELQNEGDALYFIANLHSLTTVQDAAKLREFTLDTALTYLSFGVDPQRAILFRQSDVPEHSELFWILGSLVPLSHLERAHSYKEKTAKGLRADFGLFAYPILMAADILLYGSDLVPVGKDQKQHVEFARDWAIKFNQTYVPKYDPADPNGVKNGRPGVLRVPEPRIQAETATILGVDGQKMSKSYDNTIELFAPDNVIKKRIMGIKTDSSGVADPKPVEGSPLHSLLQILAPPSEFAELDRSWREGGSGYGVYKQRLLELFHATFDAARERRKEWERDPGAVEAILRDGAARARTIASEQLERVKLATGLR